ncbi:hypothetical protein ACP70R_047205 [Stipagrostis hirtigluma subsp. patula]
MVDEAVQEPICGICLTKSPHAIRGELDGCAHRFCFVCIMTWALDESRCPLCDAPFRAVRRPPVPGLFPSERVVPILDRDQEHGNEHADPYADTTCSVCNSPDDEDLLLLCDLCDSAAAAHTYCVGLGDTVPEGDWFCSDCAETREEHFRILQLEKHWRLGQRELEHELDMSIHALRAERAALAARSVRRTEYEGGRMPVLHDSNGLEAEDLPRKFWESLQVSGCNKAPVHTGLKTHPLGIDLEGRKVEVSPDQEDGAHEMCKTHCPGAQGCSSEVGIREEACQALRDICDKHKELLKTTRYCYYFRQPKTGSSDDVHVVVTIREQNSARVEAFVREFMLAEGLDAVRLKLDDSIVIDEDWHHQGSDRQAACPEGSDECRNDLHPQIQ